MNVVCFAESAMARELEASIEAHGRAILQAAGGRPALFDLHSWQGKMLDWAMRDEAFKVQLFRFVDVLPSLTRPEAVLAHLREYFDAPNQELAGWLRVGLRSLGGGWLARQAADRVTDAIERMATTFIAGALAAAERRGLPPTAVELQMLYGMADPLQDALVRLGSRLRSYVPVGELVPGMAYLVRRLLENTSNEGFLRARFAANQAPDELLRAPQPAPAVERPEPTTDGFRNEPQPDFSRPEQRRGLAGALGTVRGALGVRVPLLIGSDWRETAESLASVNPARPDEVVGVAACAGAEEAEEALAAAEDAASWAERPVAERADRLRALAGLLRRDRWELAATVVLEVGKGWRDAAAEVGEAIDFCEYYARQAERQLNEQRLGDYPGELNHCLQAPLGPGVVIAPWNFPLAILTGMAMAAVVAGNPVLLKPAEQSPAVAWKLTRLVQEAGFPSGVVQLLPGRGEEVGRYLVAHPRTRFVAFTGSRAVGLQILRAAHTPRPGEVGLKRVVCEMGGKNAIIVDADADLDLAVQAVLGSAFGYQGQKCSACSRVIVLPDNATRFLDRLVEAARTLRYGPPEDPACHLGPVIDREALERIREAAEEGRRDGRVLCWRDPPGEGWYAPLVVLDGLEPGHRLVQEELFGPLLVVQRATDFEHALALANGTSYALTGGLISRSPSHLAAAKARFAAGNLYLNRGITGALVGRQPFGGYRFSGLGAHAGGADYLTQFVIPRVVSENTVRRGFAPELAAGERAD